MEAREGWSAGSDPGNGSKAMKRTNGPKEVDVYRSSHTNSRFNKRIREGITYMSCICAATVLSCCGNETCARGKDGAEWQHTMERTQESHKWDRRGKDSLL